MKALLDTNIIIHRETNLVINENIGKLYRWLEELGYTKCVHKLSADELEKYKGEQVRKSFKIKLENYKLIETPSPLHPTVIRVCNSLDTTNNDFIDTQLINEVYCGRVNILITEDNKILNKADLLSIRDRVYNIESFLEWVILENPDLQDYKIKNIRLEKFHNINMHQPFFDSLRSSYSGFNEWYIKNFDEQAYICGENHDLQAFLALKIETEKENYSDIVPVFTPKKRLKVRTLKVLSNGYKIGERFIKIIFDNAINNQVDEAYVTLYPSDTTKSLVLLFEKFGFYRWGTKGAEEVYVRDMRKHFNVANPLLTYPYCDLERDAYLVVINEKYHTRLLLDSILNNENPKDFENNQPFANAIHKCYITNAYTVTPNTGDIILFYRSAGGKYKSTVTTMGVVCKFNKAFKNKNEYDTLCKNRGVLTQLELDNYWNKSKVFAPKVMEFAYIEPLPKRLNLVELIQMGFDPDLLKQGIIKLKKELFYSILKEAKVSSNRYLGGEI